MSKKFIFVQKNGYAVLSIIAPTYDAAIEELDQLVSYPHDWKCRDLSGENKEFDNY